MLHFFTLLHLIVLCISHLPFRVYLVTFTLPGALMHYLWPLKFLVIWDTQCLPNFSYFHLRKDLVFGLLLALCQLLHLSKWKIIEASFTAFIGLTFTLPSALMHYLRSLLFVTRALFFCDTVICDRHNAYLMYPMIVISENTRSFNYSWNYVSLYVFQSKILLKLLSLLSQDFLLL